MISEKLVSIIIPTFNRAHLIGETLDSVLAQTYQNWECIIVDDGSSDNTDLVVGEYVKKDPRFKYYHRTEEHLPGGNGARNYGFKMSKGEFIQWFDSDDLMAQNKIELKLKILLENDLDFVVCGMNYLINNQITAGEKLVIQTNLFKDYVLWNLKIFTPSILFKRNLLKHKFDEKLLRGQETEYLSQFFYLNLKSKFQILNLPLFQYRQHHLTKTQQNKEYQPKFKKSQTLITFNNFNRASDLNDQDLMNHLYQDLIKKYFLAIINKDFKLKRYIYKSIFKNKKLSNYLNLERKFVLFFTNYLNLYSHKLRSYLMQKDLL